MSKHDEYHAETERTFLEKIGIPFPYNRPTSEWSQTDPKKIVARADPHNPYSSARVLAELESKHKDADTIIVTGDEGDYYSKSRFRKTKEVKFRDELKSIFFDLEWMATHWKNVKVMLGNHDNRPEKKFQDLLEKDTDLLMLTEQNLLKHLASYFDNIEVVGHQIPKTDINLTHIYQHGDIVFTHGELSRAQRTAVLERISLQLYRWGRTYQLKPYKIIAQSHNHVAMKMPMDNEWWFSLPTACDPYSTGMEYIFSSRMIGTPPNVGYSVFYQDAGETDINASDNVVLQ